MTLNTLPKAVLSGALALGIAGCTEGQQLAVNAPIPPGGMRRVTRTPVDWDLVSQNLDTTIYRCRPLACPTPAMVVLKKRPALARHPDPDALEHYALVDAPKIILAEDAAQKVLSDGKKHTEMLTTRAGTALERPAVLIELKRTVDGKVAFVAIDDIFAGPIMVQVRSTAATLAQAHADLDLFLAATTLTDGPGA